jgi:CelD/BcsL family acetyltransferase involved in cellulose biosynthesis
MVILFRWPESALANGLRAGQGGSMTVTVQCAPIDDADWATFATKHPQALPFHDPAWAATVAETYGFRPFSLLVRDGQGRIRAGLPVIEVRHGRGEPTWSSLPFTDQCPPLVDGEVDDLAGLLDGARQAAGIRRIEVRGTLTGPAQSPIGEYVTHATALRGTEQEIFRTFHANQVRRNVRKAEQAGVTVRTGTTEADVTEVFYRLHTRTRRRLGVPVQPLRYFRTLWRRALRPGLGVVMIAEVAGEPAAAGIYLASTNTCVYKYGASDERLWASRPNHLLFWTAIRWAHARGCESFDFGRTDLEDRSLWEFKTRWGTEQRQLTYHRIGEPAVARGGMSPTLRSLIRRGPLLLPRVIGELRYRYHA